MSIRLVPALTIAALVLAAPASHAQQTGKYSAPRTPWGDPDLQGSYTNKDENGTPFERPAEFAGKSLSDVSEKDLVELRKSRQAIRFGHLARTGVFAAAGAVDEQ